MGTIRRGEALAYAAGYFDGEGCITVCKVWQGDAATLRITIVSGDKPSVELFGDIFGGKVTMVLHKNSKTKVKLYRWSLNGIQVFVPLKAMYPFLRAKKEEARLVINSGWVSWQTGKNRHGPMTQEQKNIRIKLKHDLKMAKIDRHSGSLGEQLTLSQVYGEIEIK